MPAGHTPVRDSGGDVGTTVNGKGGNLMQMDRKKDPLPRLQSRSYREIDDGTYMAYVQDGSRT